MDSSRYVELFKDINWKKCESDSPNIFKNFFLLEIAMLDLAKYDSKKDKWLIKLDTDLTDKVVEINDAAIKISEIERAINILVNRKVFEKISGGWLFSSFVDTEKRKESISQ